MPERITSVNLLGYRANYGIIVAIRLNWANASETREVFAIW